MKDVEQALFTTYENDGIFQIQCSGLVPGPGHVYATLLVGEQSAILWDNGFGDDAIGEYVHELTSLPVIPIVSHVHFDHMGAYAQFSDLWLHERELPSIPRMFPDEKFDEDNLLLGKTKLHVIREDCQIDLGNRKVDIFLTPGHTQGSICLYDHKTRLVLAGDTVNQRVFLFCAVPPVPLRTYRESLEKIQKLDAAGILAGHHPEPIPPSWIDRLLRMVDNFTPQGARVYDRKDMGSNLMLFTEGRGFGDPDYCGFAYCSDELEELMGITDLQIDTVLS